MRKGSNAILSSFSRVRPLFLVGAMALVGMGTAFVSIRAGSHVVSFFQSIIGACARFVGAVVNFFSFPENIAMLSVWAFFTAGFLWGVVFVFREIWNTRKTILELERRVKEKRGTAAVVHDMVPFVFTIGFLRPRIFVSTALCKSLNSRELDAVLAHEEHHRANGHPLFRLVGEGISRFLFFIPFFRSLLSYIIIRQEVSADQRALRHTPRAVLAAALLKVYNLQSVWKPSFAANFSSFAHRVQFIVNGKDPHFRASWRVVSVSCIMFFVLVFPFFSTSAHTQSPFSAEGDFSSAPTFSWEESGVWCSSHASYSPRPVTR